MQGRQRSVSRGLAPGCSKPEALHQPVERRPIDSERVYRKAGVAGRAELSAFFLEDLLLPLQTTPSVRHSPT
jgi:hypothetical protein